MANSGKLHKLIDEWNAILDYKMDEANLRKPNFGFLFGTLESLLRHLNYDINAMKESVDETDKERLFYFKFVAYVNRLYQLSDPSSRFTIMDLLEPSPKKTLHVLDRLLNYLKYYCMLKEEVRTKTDKVLKNYNSALKENNDLKTKIEMYKKRKEQSEQKRVDYEKNMPTMLANLAEVKGECASLQQEMTVKMEEIKEVEANLLKLEMQEVETSEMLVSDDEYNKRVAKIQQLKGEVVDLEAHIQETREKNETSEGELKKYAEMVDKIKHILKIHSPDRYEEFCKLQALVKTSDEQISQLKHEIDDMKSERKHLICSIEDNLTQIKQKELEIGAITQELEVIRIKTKEQGAVQKYMLNDVNEELSLLKERVTELERQQLAIVDWFAHLSRQSIRAFAKGKPYNVKILF